MRFGLFILANALLFIRPSEFIAELGAVELYRYVIMACLAVSLPIVLQQFSVRYASVPPIAACVLLLLPAIFLSGMSHGDFDLLGDTVIEFAKVLIYFLLMLALITDLAKLRQFLYAIGIFSAIVTGITILRYHTDSGTTSQAPAVYSANGRIKGHSTFVVDKVRDAQSGEVTEVQRMCGTGIFNDPNDFALVLVTAIPMCLYWLTDPTRKATRPLWLLLLFLFAYALMLTHSRGGFLALMAGMLTLFHLRFGTQKTLLLGAIFLPLLFAVFAGRMTTISSDEGTAQARIKLWSDGLRFFLQSPLVGSGMDTYLHFSSHVAHNSFIHSYAELGFLGGTLFLGAFWFAIKGLFSLRQRPATDETDDHDPEFRRFHPYLMAMLISYTVGICFLSRGYIVPTYMILGLAVVYLRLHAGAEIAPAVRWTAFAWPRLAGVSCGFLFCAYTFVRVFVQ